MAFKNVFIVINLLLFALPLFSQTGTIRGRVFNEQNNEAIPFANIGIVGTNTGTSTDIDGNYRLINLSPGVYNVSVSCLGYKNKTIFEVQATSAKTTFIDIALESATAELQAVEVKASPFNKTEESPVSLRTIGIDEIQRNPGGNRDISKVIQSLPGVASTASFRNDIIIRGGAPNENRFYLDGIEVPNINHFATQGSSGGPVGMINVNFIREVDFYSGAFPSNRGNALSSVMEFKQKDGNSEKLAGTFTIGSSDYGLMLDGPLGKKSTYMLSIRRSYLQLLFKALKLPFLPVYNDMQFKQKIQLNNKNQITLIGLGAIDDFKLNTSVNDKVKDQETIERNNYILGYLPVNTQWNYTIGANYRHFADKSYQTVVLSRNHLTNNAVKYFNNDNSSRDNLILDYTSQEIENKLRIETTWRDKGYKINAGLNAENVSYTNSTFNKRSLPAGVTIIDFESALNFNKYGAFVQASKNMLAERLTLSLGLRTDFSDYSNDMSNPIDQLSPRFSLAYAITEKLSFNFNTGRYYQLPPYTVLGYRDSTAQLVNKENNVTYIKADHIVAGFAYELKSDARITVEGFYKMYNKYPLLLNDSISLANLGGDFGVIGNEPVSSASDGRSYGAELLIQQKLYKGFYGILAYTFVRSEFKDKTSTFKPSSWDNRHIISLTAGKKFKKNWEAGIKWRLLGGAPYTPYDIATSSLKTVWDVTSQAIPDYNRLNTLRLSPSHSLDIRIDKKYYFNKWALNAYIDVQNIYNYQTELQPYLNVKKDAQGVLLTDPNNPAAYQTYYIRNTSGTLLPSLGIMIEF